jgi:hypothetical protein
MREAYIKMQENCGIKVGDKVKVLRKAESYENGWSNTWFNGEMDKSIRGVGQVLNIDSYGILINISDENWYFPFFVLEKVEEEDSSMNLGEAYLKMQENCGIEIGDRVKVLRKAESYENGWSVVWAKEMDEYIGEVGEVVNIDSYGILINISDESWYFPFFVLEKVEEEDSDMDLREAYIKVKLHF